uniref:Uncharacterized protein n=1 Tax=Cucumis sativus TaxID=3659 RepID=A0A0A0KI29_CUCSA
MIEKTSLNISDSEGDFSGRDCELCFPLSSFNFLVSSFRFIPEVPLAIHEKFSEVKRECNRFVGLSIPWIIDDIVIVK